MMGLGDRPPPWEEAKEPILRSPRVVTSFIAVFIDVALALLAARAVSF